MLTAIALFLLANCAVSLRVLRRLRETQRSQEQDSLMLAALLRSQELAARDRGMRFREMPVEHLQDVVNRHAH